MIDITSVTTSNSTIPPNDTIKYVRTGTLLLCMTVGMLTNIIFIVTISKSRGLYRRSLFGLCLNLDCIFLLDIFTNQSITVIASIRENWEIPDPICIAQSFSTHVVDTCLSLTLFMLGIDRLIAVRANVNNDPKRAKGLTRDSVSLSIICLWLLSICFSIPLVTKTIPSDIFPAQFSCFPQLNASVIYTYSNLSLTLCVPLVSVVVMYVHIAVVWSREKRDIAVLSPSSVTFQIETEVANAVFTVVLHFLWIIMVGPYLTWMYIPNLRMDLAVIFSWMRHFFCWIPFIAMILYHKSFRQTFSTVFVGHKYRSSSASNIAVEPTNQFPYTPSSSQNMCSTNVASNHHSNSMYRDDDDGYSTVTLSHSSSAVSNRPMHQLPKFPILYADGLGVHVIQNNLSNCHSLSSSTREGATLCDVRQNSFTDASDAMSMTTQEGSFKQSNKVQRRSCDIDLPADISDMYNLDDLRTKRMKRRPQTRQKSLRNPLESAFETPVETSTGQSNIFSDQLFSQFLFQQYQKDLEKKREQN